MDVSENTDVKMKGLSILRMFVMNKINIDLHVIPLALSMLKIENVVILVRKLSQSRHRQAPDKLSGKPCFMMEST